VIAAGTYQIGSSVYLVDPAKLLELWSFRTLVSCRSGAPPAPLTIIRFVSFQPRAGGSTSGRLACASNQEATAGP
jgi:hypothetical protein